MKLNNFKRSLGGAILTASLLFGVGAAASVTAQAQYRDDQNRRDRDYEREQRRRERENRRNQRENRRDQRGNDRDGFGNYGGSYQLRQTALNAGYNQGIKEGRKDRDRNDRFDYSDEGDYQSASKDYSSRLGDRYTYKRYFRDGFQNGYRAGYNGY